ncbi:MAG: alpha/beta fold hydrolase [Acidilobus sp.]
MNARVQSYARTKDRISLYYEVLGEGEPLVLVEGLGYAHWMWVEQRPLSEHVKLVIYDNRGAGLSSKPKGPYTMNDFTNDLEDLLDTLSIDRAFIWGVSMGGMIAMHFAVKHSKRVKGLVLGETNFGTSSLPPSQEALNILLKPPSPELDKKRSLIERMKVAFSEDFVKNNSAKVEQIAELRMQFEEDPEAYKSQLAAVLTFDFKDRLKDVRSPTLIVTGDKDMVVNPANSYIMNQLIPNSRLIILKGAGHLAIIERPKDYNQLVLDFIGKVNSSTFKPLKSPVVI